ncbi:MAG TPA: hypothetical protein VMW73_12875 [Spirochaetia bacterium]|nr:hypothetical protein [Spirochaetia bacterium]
MVRIAKQSDPRRLRELKSRIDDPLYIASAILRIAQTLANELYEGVEVKDGEKRK